MTELIDYYHVLQVIPEADPKVIRAAYRALAQCYHPDRQGGSDVRMTVINAAWSVLRDPVARAAYGRARAVLGTRKEATQAAAQAADRPKVPSSASGMVLDFGRYAGWSLAELARHDPDFLEWLARMPIGRAYRKQIEALLAAQRPRPPTPEKAHQSRFRGR